MLATSAGAGESFKPFKLKTLDGSERRLSDVLGKTTLVAFFFPTCPYCNAAFPELQRLYDRYKDQGLSMVWINVIPDEERLIADWTARHRYTVPVLLGRRSVQNDYKLVMTPTHYLLDAKGQVLSRRAGYTAGDEQGIEHEIREALGLAPKAQTPSAPGSDPATDDRAGRHGAAAVTRTTPHLSLTATLSPHVVTEGARLSVALDVVPAPGMHVYAPGTQYRAIEFSLDPDPVLRAHEPVYPEATPYVFKPLNERVRVYSTPFRLTVDFSAGPTPEAWRSLKRRRRLIVSGRLDYQACDDRVCYLPASIPLRWVVPVR